MRLSFAYHLFKKKEAESLGCRNISGVWTSGWSATAHVQYAFHSPVDKYGGAQKMLIGKRENKRLVYTGSAYLTRQINLVVYLTGPLVYPWATFGYAVQGTGACRRMSAIAGHAQSFFHWKVRRKLSTGIRTVHWLIPPRIQAVPKKKKKNFNSLMEVSRL